jgi:CRISPR-associated protein Cas5d
MRPFCLEVTGDYACFTRPEMKVERASYDLITPSAARSVFDAILWKPAIRWRIRKIEVLKPVRWISVRRNEVSSVVSNRNALAAMNEGHGRLALYIEDDRQQRAGLFLRDVAYRLYAEMEFLTDESRGNPAKYAAMFTRRAAAGQCVNQPYLGCREFAASFRPVAVLETGRGAYGVAETEPAAVQEMSADLGWMLYDLDYADRDDPRPQFFRARVERGVMDLAGVEVRG